MAGKLKKLGIGLMALLAAVAVAYYLFIWDSPIPDFDRKVLVFSKTSGYRHDSIAAGVEAVTKLGREQEFNVVASEDASLFNQEELANYQAVIFLNTTGDVLGAEQQEAFQRYIQAGGGFVGIHSAADTEWEDNAWPWYTRLVGAAFLSHPSDPSNVQQATLRVQDRAHSSTALLDDTWQRADEWYDYQRLNPAVNVLMTVDESSYQGAVMGDEHPIAWYHDYDGGRSFYTGLGHTEESYSEKAFLQHLVGGITYAMGDGAGLDYHKAMPESWRLKRVILDSGMDEPMAMLFEPKGELYYIQRKGQLMYFDASQGKSVELAKVDVYHQGENGLIGATFDPDYASNQKLYLFHTLQKGDKVAHTLSRYTFANQKLDLASGEVLLEIPIDDGPVSHTGGNLQFDKHGNLWISVGDNTIPHESDGYSPHDDRPGRQRFDAARGAGNTQDLRGKILRIKPLVEGGYAIPEDNLFADSAEGRPEIFVMGLRNPFRMYVDPKTDALYWGEVGPDARDYSDQRGPWGYDEFNRTEAAGNFGWPFVIGNNEPYYYYDFEAGKNGERIDPQAPENRSANNTGARVLPPAQPAWMYYPYIVSEKYIELGEGGRSAMTGAIYHYDDYPDNPLKLPHYYQGKLFIYDWVRRWVKAVTVEEDGSISKIEPFLEEGLFSAPIDFKFAPDGSIYMLEYGSSWFSQNEDAYLTRIEYYGAENPPPIAVASVDKPAGAVPLTVKLSAEGSFDRNGPVEELSFAWDLMKSGKPVQRIADTADAEFSMQQASEYQIQLTVTDAEHAADSASVLVLAGNEPPAIDIDLAGGNSTFYWDNTTLDYQVMVKDLEDGASDDGSIPAVDVTVTFAYIPQGYDVAQAAIGHQEAAGSAAEGMALMKDSDCFACHAQDKSSVGPSFTAIAQRYADDKTALEKLAAKVLNGGGGVWGQHAMAPHPQHDENEARAMIAAIIQPNQRGATGGGLPLDGKITFDQHEANAQVDEMLGEFNSGTYILQVSYTDKGGEGAKPLSMNESRIYRHPRLKMEAATTINNAIAFPIPGQETKILIFKPATELTERAWASFEKIDLTGIDKVRVGVATSKLITGGGELGLRLDSPDGTLLGKQTIEVTNLAMPTDTDFYDFDVQDVAGQQNIYLVSEALHDEKNSRPDYIVAVIEFIRE
ncbi:MAG: ThuA domain-containing protein [Pseudomonadales bacterium]